MQHRAYIGKAASASRESGTVLVNRTLSSSYDGGTQPIATSVEQPTLLDTDDIDGEARFIAPTSADEENEEGEEGGETEEIAGRRNGAEKQPGVLLSLYRWEQDFDHSFAGLKR